MNKKYLKAKAYTTAYDDCQAKSISVDQGQYTADSLDYWIELICDSVRRFLGLD